jgi:hypothetical protein
MSQQADGISKTLAAGEILVAFRRVKLSGATVVYADAGEKGIGTVQLAAAAIGDFAHIRMDGAAATGKVMASGAIAAGVKIYPAADGKVSAVPSGVSIGEALEAATADGDVIEAIMVDADGIFAGLTVLAVAANVTLDIQDVGKLLVVTADAKTITLPATAAGMNFNIINGGAFGTIAVNVSPNASDKIMGADVAGTNDKDQINTKATAAPGDYLVLVGGNADGYVITHKRGTWAEEA